jgi:C4-dicarboxylate transporter DctQ subunit
MEAYLMRLLNAYDLIIRVFVRLIEWIAIFLMFFMTTVCLVNVICRFILLIPLVWADEMMRYCSVWIIFMLCPVLVIQKGHLMVAMTTLLMPKFLWKPLLVLGNVMCATFMAVMLPGAVQMVIMGRIQVSVAMGLPMSLVYACIPFSIFLMMLSFIRVMIGEIYPERAALPAYGVNRIERGA